MTHCGHHRPKTFGAGVPRCFVISVVGMAERINVDNVTRLERLECLADNPLR
jgi:hypothetical protein